MFLGFRLYAQLKCPNHSFFAYTYLSLSQHLLHITLLRRYRVVLFSGFLVLLGYSESYLISGFLILLGDTESYSFFDSLIFLRDTESFVFWYLVFSGDTESSCSLVSWRYRVVHKIQSRPVFWLIDYA